MIFRIDIQHFLSHMIDYFTREELIHFQYAIISSAIPNQGKCENVVKLNNLYPDIDTITAYADYKDEKIAKKMYIEMLETNEDEYQYKRNRGDKTSWADYVLYKAIVNPLANHYDVILLCDQSENIWIDTLSEYLKDKFSIEVIDLNELFINGEIGPISIDRKKILNSAVDVRRSAAKRAKEGLESSREGRLKLLNMMSKKEKISKLKDLGIVISESDMKNLNALLIDSWVDELNDDGS